MKKVLVLGATGAMGVYLVPELLKMGYQVDGVSIDDAHSDNENLRYIKADAQDIGFLSILLKNGYDGIVDFMIYEDKWEFTRYMKLFLENTSHYIFLSSYRVYDGSDIINENSPRLLESSNDKNLLSINDYPIYKAECENELKVSKYTNYTILRPAITYSKRRFQLTNLEANVFLYRTFENKKVVLPIGAKDVQATLSWAGDVGKMISKLLFNENTYTEVYNVCTSEHMTWGEIADIYKELCGTEAVWVDDEEYLAIRGSNQYCKNQLVYDREMNRVMDNTKILNTINMKQSELMPIKEGLKMELAGLKKEDLRPDTETSSSMDEYLKRRGL